MQQEKRTIRFGVALVAVTLLLRLLCGNILSPVLDAVMTPEVFRTLLFLQTGRLPSTAAPDPEQPAQTQQVSAPAADRAAVFAADDEALVAINSYCGYETDTAALLQTPLDWDLTEGGPKVLILHSHGSESYEKTENYQETTQYRTLDTQYNVVSLGDRLAQLLEDGGVEVIHDRTIHDYPSYTSSYSQARKSIQAYLKQYPDICLVLDLHRDALQDASGNQVGYTVQTAAGEAARVMLVVGTNQSGLSHPNWKENLALAVKLHAQLEKKTPGLCRPISFRSQRFNQDLSTGALIVEVGAAGNTRQEALVSIELLAQSILSLARGTETVY